jgi:putative FmdB family regulatory protein
MPIYAYKCDACGHAKDALQKISDAPLTVCPACGASAFKKQLTAAGFQLKGSGWYVTDFRNGNNSGAPAAKSGEGAASADASTKETKPAAADGAAAGTAASPAASTTPLPASASTSPASGGSASAPSGAVKPASSNKPATKTS